MPSRATIKSWIAKHKESRRRLRALRRKSRALARRTAAMEKRISGALLQKNGKLFRAFYAIKRDLRTGRLITKPIVAGTSTSPKESVWTFDIEYTWDEDCGSGCDQAMVEAVDHPEYPGGEVWCTCQCSQRVVDGRVYTTAMVDCHEI
jgi:hypothetical protein